MGDSHAELLAYLTSIDAKVDRVGEDVKAIRETLNDKVDQRYCVERCQRRWVSRTYFLGGASAAAMIAAVVAFYRDIAGLFGGRTP